MRRDDQRQAVKNIPLEQLKPFKNHPFQVRDDEEFRRLVESIEIHGVIHPAVARQIGEDCYELISGHRRKAACEVLGYQQLTLNLFLSEAEQIQRIDEAENVKTSSAFSFTQEQPRPEAADQEAEAAKPTLRELHEKYKPIVLEAVSQDIRYEDDLRVKSARLVELDTLLNLDGRGRSQPESVIAKSARPSVLDSLKRPVPPRNPDKKPKQHEEVR